MLELVLFCFFRPARSANSQMELVRFAKLRDERAAYDKTGHPSSAGLVWPEVV